MHPELDHISTGGFGGFCENSESRWTNAASSTCSSIRSLEAKQNSCSYFWQMCVVCWQRTLWPYLFCAIDFGPSPSEKRQTARLHFLSEWTEQLPQNDGQWSAKVTSNNFSADRNFWQGKSRIRRTLKIGSLQLETPRWQFSRSVNLGVREDAFAYCHSSLDGGTSQKALSLFELQNGEWNGYITGCV